MDGEGDTVSIRAELRDLPPWGGVLMPDLRNQAKANKLKP